MNSPEEIIVQLESLVKKYKTTNQPFQENSLFSAMGMDSFAKVDYFMDVEESFGVIFSDDELLEIQTVKQLMDKIQEAK